MVTEELVNGIIAGSKAIDRMRLEIDLIVKTVLGLISEEDFLRVAPPRKFISFSINSDSWQLHNSFMGMEVLFQLGSGRVIYSTDGRIRIPLIYVNALHGLLPLFVAGMVKTFPGLEKELEPLLDVAQK